MSGFIWSLHGTYLLFHRICHIFAQYHLSEELYIQLYSKPMTTRYNININTEPVLI